MVEIASSNGFTDVPLDASGEPMLATGNEYDYQAYIGWLADFLYRPGNNSAVPLSEKEASLELISIEIEIADWIWTHPYGDYPPADCLPANGARHADILHREAISKILSRVSDRALRVKLIHSFYLELACDANK